jgi:hypothetical protein
MQDKIFRLIPEQHGNIKSAAHIHPRPQKKTLGYRSNGSKLNWLVQEKQRERELHKFLTLSARYKNNFNLRSLTKMTIHMMHKPITTVPRLPSN